MWVRSYYYDLETNKGEIIISVLVHKVPYNDAQIGVRYALEHFVFWGGVIIYNLRSYKNTEFKLLIVFQPQDNFN